MPTVLGSAIGRGGAIGWTDPSYTEVTLDTTNADLLLSIYSCADLSADDGPLTDSQSNTWTALSLLPGNEPHSVKVRHCVAPSTSATHRVRIATAHPGQSHAALELIALQVYTTTAPTTLYWLPNIALFGSSTVASATAASTGLAISLCCLQFDTATGTGLATPDGAWTLVDRVAATAGATGTAGIATASRTVVAGDSLTATWTYDSPQNAWAGILGFVVSAAPVIAGPWRGLPSEPWVGHPLYNWPTDGGRH